ncbi:efflux RND transporter permease subunit [Xanthomonas hydrangeae]|uniref:efflux RND transporter permease subunit n=1 Tax=Xanthomonas hydrangeae TaxID=2775159 RepID=UPI003515AD6D
MVLALAVAGLVAAFSLPVGLFPQADFPRVVVDLDAGWRTADQTALLVTRPIEEAVRAVPGVVGIRSESSRGSAQISIDFGWGRDMTATTLQVDSAISRVLPGLPAGTHYDVRRMDPTVFPILSYSLQGKDVSPVLLRDVAQLQIVPLLSSIPGLARTSVQGGQTREIQVEADPQVLGSYGLALSDLSTALRNANVLQAAGQLQDSNRLYLVLATHTLADIKAVGEVVIRRDPHGWLRLKDVASIRSGDEPQWVKVAEDGTPAILLNIYAQPDGNAVQIASEVRARLASAQLPAGAQLRVWYDQSDLVLASAASVRDAVIIGLLLASAVVLYFLRSLRVTLVALLVVPVILAITVLLLTLLGMSFNIMTLGGIAAAVGLLIDDVIVMIEHIARRTGGGEEVHGRAATTVLQAAREFMAPLAGSSLATLIVFVPLAFLDGVTGAFSKALSITMGCALIVSWLMSAFIVPPLAARMIDFTRWQDPGLDQRRPLARIHAALYDGMAHRQWLLAVMLMPLLVLGIVAYANVSTGFMPAVDESGFVMDFFTKPGTSLQESERQVAQIETLLRQLPDVDTFSRRLGTGLGGDLGQSYHGDFFVRLKAGHARPTEEIMAALRSSVIASVPGVDVELAQLMEDLIGDLTSVPQPIELKLYASDPRMLDAQAANVARAIASIDGVVDIKSGSQLAGDALELQIDADRVADEGMTVADLTQAATIALQGEVATQLSQPNKTIGVRVWMPDARTASLSSLAHLQIRAPDGHLFPVSRVAKIVPVRGQPQIGRDNLEPMVAVTARIEGRGLGAAVHDVRQLMAKPGLLAAGARYELGGLYHQQQIAFSGLIKVFAAAIVAEFLLLIVLYGEIVLAVIVIACSLLSITAVFIALWICGVDLNITSMMGLTMVIGIGTEMAIFLVSEYKALSKEMSISQALRQASRNRLRPISMTTLAAILTLLPLSLAIGQGAGIQQPLAISIIAGLLLQYPLVLLVMPMLIRRTRPETEALR